MKIDFKGSAIRIGLGVLIIIVAQLIKYNTSIADLGYGIIMGIGIGLLIVSLLLTKYRKTIVKK